MLVHDRNGAEPEARGARRGAPPQGRGAVEGERQARPPLHELLVRRHEAGRARGASSPRSSTPQSGRICASWSPTAPAGPKRSSTGTSSAGRQRTTSRISRTRSPADRLSCSSYRANAFRLQLHALAYNLLVLFRRLVLRGTSLASATIGTIRLRLLKVRRAGHSLRAPPLVSHRQRLARATALRRRPRSCRCDSRLDLPLDSPFAGPTLAWLTLPRRTASPSRRSPPPFRRPPATIASPTDSRLTTTAFSMPSPGSTAHGHRCAHE